MSLHAFATEWGTDGPIGLAFTLLAVASGVVYLLAAEVGRRRDRRRRRWPLRRSACFIGGLAVLVVDLDSGIGSLADDHLSAHMIEHMVMWLIVGAAAGGGRAGPAGAVRLRPRRPATAGAVAALATGDGADQPGRLGRVLLGRAARHPPAGGLRPDLAATSGCTSASTRSTCSRAVLIWAPLLGVDPLPGRLPAHGRALCMAACMVPMAIVGVWLLVAGAPGLRPLPRRARRHGRPARPAGRRADHAARRGARVRRRAARPPGAADPGADPAPLGGRARPARRLSRADRVLRPQRHPTPPAAGARNASTTVELARPPSRPATGERSWLRPRARRRAQLRPAQAPQDSRCAGRRARRASRCGVPAAIVAATADSSATSAGGPPSQISTPAKARPSASRRAASRSRTSSERCGYHGVAGRSPPRSHGAVIDTNNWSVASTQSSRPGSSNRHQIGNRGVLARTQVLRAVLGARLRAGRIVVEQRPSQQLGLRRSRRRRFGLGRPRQRLRMIDVPPKQLTGRRRRIGEAREHPRLGPDRERDLEVAGVVDELTQVRAGPFAGVEQPRQPRPSAGVTREQRLDQRVQRRPLDLEGIGAVHAQPRYPRRAIVSGRQRPSLGGRPPPVVACSRLDRGVHIRGGCRQARDVSPPRWRCSRSRRWWPRRDRPPHPRRVTIETRAIAPHGVRRLRAAGPVRHGQRRGRAQAA